MLLCLQNEIPMFIGLGLVRDAYYKSATYHPAPCGIRLWRITRPSVSYCRILDDTYAFIRIND
jgi:hypothetical protein